MRTILSLLAVWLLAAVPVQAIEQEATNYTATYMEERIEEGSFKGAIVSIVQDGEVVLADGYGMANASLQVEADADTLFRAGSVGKSMTAAAVLQQIEAGTLSLEASITEMLSIELANEPAETVKIPHLLTHTAGFDETMTGFYATSYDEVDPVRFIEERTPALKRSPGTEVEYSNVGLAIAGQLVEDASGVPFPDYVEARIFEPLGMNDSSFEQHENPADVAASYIGNQPYPYSYIHMVPAGSITTSANDMALYMLAHLEQNEELASSESFSLMHEPQFHMHEDVPGMHFGHYGSQFGGLDAVRHDGSIDAFMSTMMLVPELDLGIFVSTNGVTGIESQRVIADYLSGLAEAMGVETEPHTLAETPTTEDDLANFSGSYTMNRVNEKGPLSIISIFNPTISIEAASDGTLSVDDLHFSGGRYTMQESSSPLVFQQVNDDETLALLENDQFISSVYPMMVFDRVPLIGERYLSYAVLGFIGAVAVFFLLVIPVRGLYRIIRRRKVPDKRLRILAFFTVLFLLLAAGTMAASVQLLIFGYVTAGTFMLAAPLVPLLLALIYALVWWRTDRAKSSVGFLFIQAAVALFAAFALYWQMTPFHV
ncbi:serine hydrolase domain-containing protein [Alkalicoccus luteus]|uniref:serine hydrolase domain-containing protein n=1 Tax=Alkalicoccus luteus TaxID=1237094 RepID=UPI0040339B80